MAEREGFEPSIRLNRIPDFESGAFDHSATFPLEANNYIHPFSKSKVPRQNFYPDTECFHNGTALLHERTHTRHVSRPV